MESVKQGHHKYSWRGISCIKSPFEIALYPLLFWKVKPASIIEFGTHMGGSAVWMADMCRALDIDASVVSIDNLDRRVDPYPGVEYFVADALSPPEKIWEMPHPWIVIDDASHNYDLCLALLEAVTPRLESGDYYLLEDGVVTELGVADSLHDGGPVRAWQKFVEEHPDEYEIDRSLCDFFGKNATFNTDGYLKRR
jgi:cephalosporin hydroxylase